MQDVTMRLVGWFAAVCAVILLFWFFEAFLGLVWLFVVVGIAVLLTAFSLVQARRL